MKNIITKINSLGELMSRKEKTKERVSELEDRLIKNIQSEQQREDKK